MQNLIISVLTSAAIIGVAMTLIVGEVKSWKFKGSAHAQNLAALGGQVAKEACLLAEDMGLAQKWDGVTKFDKAVTIFNDKMDAAGFGVDIHNARDAVQVAHSSMTLDKTTAYNDAPASADTGSRAMPATASA